MVGSSWPYLTPRMENQNSHVSSDKNDNYDYLSQSSADFLKLLIEGYVVNPSKDMMHGKMNHNPRFKEC